MTVQELIDSLNKIEDKTTKMVVRGYEDGFDDISYDSFEPLHIELNVNTEWFYGSHGRTASSNPKAVKAILIK
jgi:hypothetical protein